MRLFPKFSKQYNALKRPAKLGLEDRPYILPIIGLVLGVLLVGVVLFFGDRQDIRPSSSHVVFVSDNGRKETVNTRAPTVGDLVKKMPLKLISQDVVEPSLDTPIVEDNFRINIYRARPVTVVVGGEKSVVLSGQRSARVIAQAAGLNVYPEDLVVFEPGQVSQGVLGEEVVVERSAPLTLNLYGTPITVRTHATTVAGLLAEKQIVLASGDSVKPSLNSKLKRNAQVFVVRKGTKIQTVLKLIPAPVQRIKDNKLTFGVTVVRQPGSPGKKLITYAITTKNGKITKTQIQAAVVVDPVTEIVAVGTNVDIPTNKTQILARAGVRPSDYQYINYIISHESGWCYTKWQGEIGYCPAYHGAPTVAYQGYGLCQATPGYKMATAGSDWAWNPVTQVVWCSNYAEGRYGSWAAAYEHWLVYNSW